MSVSKNFENIPRSPAQRAIGPVCNFFVSNLQIGRKKLQTGPVAPWVGDRGIFSKFFETDIYF